MWVTGMAQAVHLNSELETCRRCVRGSHEQAVTRTQEGGAGGQGTVFWETGALSSSLAVSKLLEKVRVQLRSCRRT